MGTKFLIQLNNGLRFTSFEEPKIENGRCTFKDREGLMKNFPIGNIDKSPLEVISIEEVKQ